MACDATRSDQVADAVAQCMERFGRIDVLVNNVGLSQPGGPVEMDEDVWDAQIQVNLKSAYLSCKHVIPHMRSQGGGAIVNVASVAGMRYVGKPQVAYAAAKAGLLHFTHTTAVPGLMHTPLIEGLAAKYAKGDTQGFIDHRNNQVPMKRMGTGWDTAHAVLFLVADESRYVTGTEIVVDGGLVAATR
jgi:NAD(P)-dependent dehydrogenase (short-subunit alcohol dehydrogenase family)